MIDHKLATSSLTKQVIPSAARDDGESFYNSMIDNNIPHPHCEHCKFSSFCSADEKPLGWMNPTSNAVKQHHYLKKNEVLYLPQNTFRSVYAIQSGQVKTYRLDTEGNELIRGFYFMGEILGLEGIHSQHYHCSAVALSDTVVCEIPYDNFLALLQLNPALQKRILYLMSQQLNAGSYLFSITAEQRLAAFLIDLAHRLHPVQLQLEFILPISRQDIGNYLKLSTETISRLLSQFKEKKIIAIDRRKIQFLQLEQLQRIADIELSFY